MKVVNWHRDGYKKNLGRETDFDLMSGEIVYDNGVIQTIYVTRATKKVMIFEQEHFGKIMTEEDFETYKDLFNAVNRVDHIYEEN